MIIKNAKVFLDGKFQNIDVRYDTSGITEIGENLFNDEIMDAHGACLYAGVVDAHCHGGFLRGFNYSTSFEKQGTHEELMREDGLYKTFVSERTEAAGWKVKA